MVGVCEARGRLVDFWVMHGMVMDETLHVFHGGGVGELFRVCPNRRCLRCTISAAALRTASSWRCAAASIGFSDFLPRCQCRACVTAPLIVVSLTRGSLKRCLMAWCAWIWVGQPSCCCSVSAGDQPTSVSLSVWRGHILNCSQSPVVGWSHRQRRCSSGTWMFLWASQQATLVRSGSCFLRSLRRRFWRWAGTFAGRSAES